MKKFLPYILILIALAGTLGGLNKAQAYDNNIPGTCITKADNHTNPPKLTTWANKMTELECHQLENTNGLIVVEFKFDKTTAAPSKICAGPVTQANAPGACRWHLDAFHAEGEVDTSNPPLTKEQCGFNFPQVCWDPNASPNPGEAVKGTCKVPSSNGNIISVETEQACKDKGGNWDPAGTLDPACKSPMVLQNGDCVNPNKSSVDPIYHFLAPLPCDSNASPAIPGCVNGQLTTFDTSSGTGNNKLGDYLNIMIRIFIGICAVLAVIMIVMGGIEYMTSELVSSKGEGKSKITHAIFGLLLALGAYLILNTINPQLLKTDLSSLTDQNVTVTLAMSETETFSSALDGDSPFAPGIVTPLCPEGIVRTASGAPACQRIAADFDKMVAAAKVAGINLSGYGYRNVANQTQLRIANCHGDTTNRNPDPPCNPLTALPGASNHNNGLAFDLRCDGQKIGSSTNACFVWLATNANKYGLQNLPSEPWHWSVDGR